MIRKITSIILGLSLILTAAPNTQATAQTSGRFDNLAPAVHATSAPNLRPLLAALPSSYDLRSLGRVSAVTNQSPYGDCWAFGAFASAESVAISEGTALSLDLSEWQMAYFGYVSQNGFPTFDTHKPGDSVFNQGGNDNMAMALMARGTSPILEVEAPYNGPSPLPDIKPSYVLKNVYTAHDATEWKTLIMEKGALSIGYYQNNKYLNTSTNSYFCNLGLSPNHGVAVVGWDDNYAVSNFISIPSAPGAWIIKNSYGSSFGDGGYFYLSYKDLSNDPIAYAYELEPRDSEENVYSYDPLGKSSNIGYTSHTSWMKNVYTSERTEYLKDVGFYSLGDNTTYEITINEYSGATPVKVFGPQSGTIIYSGYSKVELLKQIYLTAGKQFEVVIKITSPTTNYPIALERATSNYSSQAVSDVGQSFKSSNGTTWLDLSTENQANACIQAYTESTDATPTPTPTPTPTVKPTASPTLKPTPSPKPVIHVFSVKLNKKIISIIKGKSFKLIASVTPYNAANKKINWQTLE